MSEFNEVFDFLQKEDGGTFTSFVDWEKKEQGYSCSFKIKDKNKDNSLSLFFLSQTDLDKQVDYFKENKKYFLNVIKSVRSISPLGENQIMVISLECKFKEFQNNNLMVIVTNLKVNGI